MKAKSLLRSAVEKINERGQLYGSVSATHERAAIIADTVLNAQLSAYDVMMILHCVKLARIGGSVDQVDNYLDGVNYLAFACEEKFGRAEEDIVDDGAAEMAQKLAPLTYTEEALRQRVGEAYGDNGGKGE